MNFIVLYVVGILCLIQTSCLYGQDTSKTIKDILIVENRIPTEFTPSQKVDAQILQYHQHKNLQQLLELHSNVFVKNYGVGSLSTISIRGSSAAQTYVNWHGINLNNAMTGITDFSIIPSGLFDEIQIQYGSELENTSLGGGLQLINKKPVFRKSRKLCLDIGYESLQNIDMLASYTYANKYVSNTLKLNAFQGKNQFNYYNIQLDSNITLMHAKRKHQHIMNDMSIQVNRKNTISLHTWIQFTQRQIPAASFEIFSQKEEKISSARNLLIWNSHINQQINLEFLMGYLTEKYSYQDEAIFLRSNTQVNQIPLKISSEIKPGHSQHIDIEFNANHAYLENNQHQALTRGSLSLAYQKLNLCRHFSLKTTLQKEITSLFELPFTTGLVLNYDFKRQLKFYATMHNAYRMPTLNELYYFPGGNLSLKPEKSRNIEGGLVSNVTNFRYNLRSNLSGYARKVKDWITWYGNSILTPHNIQEVRNYGIEYSLDFRYQPFKIQDTNTHDLEIIVADRTSHAKANTIIFNAGILYSYNISTTASSAIPNDYSIGKQIPYVPRYQFKLNLGLNYNAYDFQLIHTYTGYRFVTTDESQFLKPYQTTNLLGSVNLPVKAHQFKFTGQVTNLMNNQYESIVGRTMPGRYFTLGLTFQY